MSGPKAKQELHNSVAAAYFTLQYLQHGLGRARSIAYLILVVTESERAFTRLGGENRKRPITATCK